MKTTTKVILDEKLVYSFLKHLNLVLKDVERIEEQIAMNKALQRLEEIKKGKAKLVSEEEFEKLFKRL